MIRLLQMIEVISSTRDRMDAATAVVEGVAAILNPVRTLLVKVVNGENGPILMPLLLKDANGLSQFSLDENDDSALGKRKAMLEWFPALDEAYQSGSPASRATSHGACRVWPIGTERVGMPSALLAVDVAVSPTAELEEAVARFLRYYGNHLGLLDYSELDTLTGLNNRKTFDEALDRILAEANRVAPPEGCSERRLFDHGESKDFWLAVVDIDHFKRINDGFGHLFGDEVLLRVANLMKQCFRDSDRLFRFGGEEFVVILRPTNFVFANNVFDRFRTLMQGHEFPQVGQVTCSVGFARLDSEVEATETLGRADIALYFAKEHGRNQVGCYEDLLRRGVLEVKALEYKQIDKDLDALFN